MKIIIVLLFIFSLSAHALDELSKTRLARLIRNRNKIIGVEFILATAPEQGPIYSKWGHALIRFVTSDRFWKTDIVLGFVADTAQDEKLSIKKALAHKYEVTMQLNTFEDTWKRYVIGENRPLVRYIIPTNKDERDSLINYVNQIAENPELLGKYSFFNNNCATSMVDFFRHAGFKIRKTRIPNKIGNRLQKAGLAPFEPVVVSQQTEAFGNFAKALGLSKESQITPEDFRTRLDAVELNDLLIVLYSDVIAYEPIKDYINERYNQERPEIDFNQLYHFTPVANELFERYGK